MNFKNYGLFLESLPYLTNTVDISELTSASIISEDESAQPDMQNEDGLAKLLSGEKGGPYTKQWNQLVRAMIVSKKSSPNSMIWAATILHDNGEPMIKVVWEVLVITPGTAGKINWQQYNGKGVKVFAPGDTQNIMHPENLVYKPKTNKQTTPSSTAQTTGPITFAELYKLCIAISNKIKNLFDPTKGEYQKLVPFKGSWDGNDRDNEAVKYFKTYIINYINPNLTKITNGVTQLTGSEKSEMQQNIDQINLAIKNIPIEMVGGKLGNTRVRWAIGNSDGTAINFSVNTDY